jgi:hypothetical protein
MFRLTLTGAALFALFTVTGCCKEGQPPSKWCKVQEKIVECTREAVASNAAGVGSEVLAALRSGPNWESVLGKVLETGGEIATCVLGNLDEVFAKRATAAGPAGMKAQAEKRKADLEKAKAFLAKRGIKVVAKKVGSK